MTGDPSRRDVWREQVIDYSRHHERDPPAPPGYAAFARLIYAHHGPYPFALIPPSSAPPPPPPTPPLSSSSHGDSSTSQIQPVSSVPADISRSLNARAETRRGQTIALSGLVSRRGSAATPGPPSPPRRYATVELEMPPFRQGDGSEALSA